MNTNQFPVNFASNDWDTQLAVFKAFYSTDDLNVKYLDDENEEIGISCQSDLDYAYQIALNSNDKILNLILTKENGDVIAKPYLKINSTKIKRSSINAIKSKEFKNETVSNTTPPNFTETQQRWLQNYLENFRKEITNEFETKIKYLMKQNEKSLKRASQINEDLIELDVDPSMSFENKVKKIIDMILKARTLGRALKSAYLEEELYAMGAFCATFVKDHNMPDGSKCEPDMKFVKTWLIQNTGKLPWNDSFPVKLICIAGNIIINSENQSVDVESTKVNETASISVELIAPSNPGNYFSEWVLSCHDFQFGPRIWCSIEVIDAQVSIQSSIATTELADTSNMSKSCFTKTNSRTSDMKSVNSLNISMIETFLSSNHQSKASQFIEDLDDDEFVVVPDCFDLTKKWKTNQIDSELQELKRSMLDDKKCNTSFVNFDDKKEMDLLNDSIFEYKSDVEKKLDQLTESVKKLSNNNNDLIMLNSATESNISSNKHENTADLTVDISVSPQALSQSQTDYLTFNPVTILENNNNKSNLSSSLENKAASEDDVKVNSINLIPLVPALAKNKSASELHKENLEQLLNSQDKKLDSLSTFDLMKNAFSNLQGPSYVSPFDLNNSKPNDSLESNLSFSKNPLPTSIFRPKKPQTPMEKLISMGFADRNLNKRLLEKYNNDLEKVIDSICQRFDINDWSLNR